MKAPDRKAPVLRGFFVVLTILKLTLDRHLSARLLSGVKPIMDRQLFTEIMWTHTCNRSPSFTLLIVDSHLIISQKSQ